MMLQSWWAYKNSPRRLNDPTEHPQPDLYKEGQLFLTIEASFCGNPLTIQDMTNTWLGASIVTQLVSALAVAEEACQFEHRDLHLGNILIHRTDVASLKYTIRDKNFAVQTFGHQVFIIDFTLSRIYEDQKVHCVELDECAEESVSPTEEAKNIWLHHTNMYGIMAKCFSGNWTKFFPKTNIVWLKHIIANIMDYLQRNNPSLRLLVAGPGDGQQMKGMRLLRRWNECLLHYESAKSFLFEVILNENPLTTIHEQ